MNSAIFLLSFNQSHPGSRKPILISQSFPFLSRLFASAIDIVTL